MNRRAILLLALLAACASGTVAYIATRHRTVRIADYVQVHGQPLVYSSLPTVVPWNPEGGALFESKSIVLLNMRDPAHDGIPPSAGECLIYCSDPRFSAYLGMVLTGEINARKGAEFAFGGPIQVVAIEVNTDGVSGVLHSFKGSFVDMYFSGTKRE